MKGLYKKVFTIILTISVLAILFALPGFAETQDELKAKFVTRASWSEWINGANGQTGFSEFLANVEQIKVESVYNRVEYEMSVRGMKFNSESSGSTP